MTKMNIGNNKCWGGCGERGSLLYCSRECELGQPFRKTLWKLFKRFKIELPYDTAIALLGIYPKDTKILIQRHACITMFIAAL